MAYKKTIELYLANGTVDSIIIGEISGWDGKAIKIPRIEINSCKREDIEKPGVYFLFCIGDDGQDGVYIGESENVKRRLLDHISDFNSGDEKYEWNTAIIMIGKDFDKAVIRYLEKTFYEMAKSCKRYNVLTQKTYNPNLKESRKNSLEEFIDNTKIMTGVLGYKVFEPIINKTNGSNNEEKMLFLKRGQNDAKGMQTNDGFVLFKGSKITGTTAPTLGAGSTRLREKYIDSEMVENLITTEDLLFNSSSQAAEFVTGCSSSGPQNWKNKDGVELREIERINND